MNEDILSDIGEIPRESPPLSPQTIAYGEHVVRDSFESKAVDLPVPEGRSLDYVSHYMNH